MADKDAKYPHGTMMQFPDQSQYVYAQAADNFESGTFIEVNQLSHLVRFKGGFKFPQGIVTETVPQDYWTFVMIRPPQVKEKSNIMVPEVG